MKRRVAIVTDSTASVPDEVADSLGIAVVQMELKIGNELNDERRVSHNDVAQAMRDGQPVETSEPPPPAFYWNYMDAVSAGAEAIVSIHISGSLSKTTESARSAAADLNVPVYVVDSRMCGLGLGYSVIAAAEAAATGASAQGVLGVLDRHLRATTQLIYVDTLEFLRRGGRVSMTQAMLGQALSIKPILIMSDGAPMPLTRGVGQDRALKRAVTMAAKRAGDGQVDIGVEHFQAEERAKRLIGQLRQAIPNVRRIILEECSAIVGAHTGPGSLGVTVSPV